MASRLLMNVQTDSCLQISKHAWLNEAKGSNFVFSPFSIYAALCLLASGSNGRTLEQILSFLKSTSLHHLNSVASQLIDLVDGTKINREVLNLSFICGIWVDNSCTLRPRFKEIATSVYKAKVEAVDFKTKADEVREDVNEWVEEETNGLIKDLIPDDGTIGQSTRLVLANALYFKGKWNTEFISSKTKKSEFYLLDGGSVQVPFMKNYEEQFVSCFNGFKVLRLPYHQQQVSSKDPYQRHFSMVILLPDKRDGLGGLIEKVSSDPSFIDSHLPNMEVELDEFRIPKFKISFGLDASTILKTLGLVLPFDEHEAGFDEMIDGGNFCVSKVLHKCFVEVDEVGTEAAAATAVAGWCISDGEPCYREWVDFVADHPFMFVIRDDLSGLVLFIGHVLNPSLND